MTMSFVNRRNFFLAIKWIGLSLLVSVFMWRVVISFKVFWNGEYNTSLELARGDQEFGRLKFAICQEPKVDALSSLA